MELEPADFDGADAARDRAIDRAIERDRDMREKESCCDITADTEVLRGRSP